MIFLQIYALVQIYFQSIINAQSDQNRPDLFNDISLEQTSFTKYVKENIN